MPLVKQMRHGEDSERDNLLKSWINLITSTVELFCPPHVVADCVGRDEEVLLCLSECVVFTVGRKLLLLRIVALGNSFFTVSKKWGYLFYKRHRMCFFINGVYAT